MKDEETIRAFIALPLLGMARGNIERTIEHIWREIPKNLRDAWSPAPREHHITLRFLGDCSQEQAASIMETGLKARAGTTLWPNGIGSFDQNGNPSVVYAEIGGDLQELARIQQRAEELAGDAGFPPADHPFHPHVTLVKITRSLDKPETEQLETLMESAREFLRLLGTTGWRVTEAVLMRTLRENDRTFHREVKA